MSVHGAEPGRPPSPRHHLELVTAVARTPRGREPRASFFSDLVERPDVVVAGLLAVAEVAASSYVESVRPDDPAPVDLVVTAGGDRLRFESFSACAGVYARLDLLLGALGPGGIGRGTATVDLDASLRADLARLDRGQPLLLSVGPADGPGESPVGLLDRWAQGLSEVPGLLRGMGPRGALVGPQIAGFLADLPPLAAPGPHVHVVPSPGQWSITSTPVPGSVPLAGTARLRSLDHVLRLAKRLHLHAHPHGHSAWELEMPGARLTLALTPHADRGFSGESSLVSLLSSDGERAADDHLAATLGWTSVVRPDEVADALHLAGGAVDAGLSRLAAAGRLGYDLAEHAWFHRDLPPGGDEALRRHPRLTSAYRLVGAGDVVEAADGGAWLVRGDADAVHAVKHGGEGWRCDCAQQGMPQQGVPQRGTQQQHQPHDDDRSPCTHLLAVLLCQGSAGRAGVDRPPAPDTLGG